MALRSTFSSSSSLSLSSATRTPWESETESFLFLVAPPSADLWEGQEDEKELGFTYDFIEDFTGYYLPLDASDKEKFIEALEEGERAEFLKNKEACEKIHNKNKHKLAGIVNL